MNPTQSNTGSIDTFLQKEENKDLVRLLTCGSVDDGKSTLIGRLFYDAQLIASDTLEALERDSKTHGTNDGGFDPALFTDGLKAEREQGITIDVSYRYFSTAQRKFIIADCPGHQQYTRNMATGASTANAAIVLIDAQNGVLEQTRRHSFIISLLGIQHVIVAVNKMDLIEYSQDTFDQIVDEFIEFTTRLDITDLHFIPISALNGDNVVDASEHMPWYKGASLMHLLDTIHIASDNNMIDFRFPVQYVNRPNAEYRGYCGQIASGSVKPGDEVVVLPSHTKTRVQSIDTFDGTIDRAYVPMSVTLTLEDQVDVSRGDMITPTNNVAQLRDQFDATIVWMDEEPMKMGAQYVLKHTSKTVQCSFDEVRYQIDVNTLHRTDEKPLQLNEIGRIAVRCNEPLSCDSYRRNRTTGAFIIIDRLSNRTVGAGMILERRPDEKVEASSVEKARSLCVQQFPVVWLTGNSGAGKSTLAFGAEAYFNQSVSVAEAAARRIVVLDGDEMRDTISTQEDLSPEGRRTHNVRVARLAQLLSQKGFLVIVSVIAPFKDVRKEIVDICDPLWVYIKRDGLEADDRPYEPPEDHALLLDHDTLEADQALEEFIAFLLTLSI